MLISCRYKKRQGRVALPGYSRRESGGNGGRGGISGGENAAGLHAKRNAETPLMHARQNYHEPSWAAVQSAFRDTVQPPPSVNRRPV